MKSTTKAHHHPDQAVLTSYLKDELGYEKSISVTQHVETCESCQCKLDEIATGSGILLIGDEILASSNFDIGKWKTHSPVCVASSEQTETDIANPPRFELIEEIARGGMGVVYRARDIVLQREVAVKIIQSPNRHRLNLQAETRFQREAQISGRLQHPGSVPIHEIGRLRDGRMFIAMKLVEGQTMRSLIDSAGHQRMQQRLLEVFQNVCNTMAYAHSKNIIHRDLKPNNIMVGAFGEVQVMDWGLAKQLADEETDKDVVDHSGPVAECGLGNTWRGGVDETSTGMVLGTPAYMAPEQSRGAKVDKRADVYALGVILCEILVGRATFTKITKRKLTGLPDSACEQILEALDQEHIAPELKGLALDCLADDPENRPANAGVLAERLAGYVDRRVELLRKSEIARARSAERLKLEAKRRRQVMLLGAGLAAFFLITTIASILYLSEKNSAQSERFKKRLENEAKIRTLLSQADKLHQTARESNELDQPGLWTDTLSQLKKAEALIDGTVSADLRNAFTAQKNQIEKAVTKSERQLRQRLKDDVARIAIRNALATANYPTEDLDLVRTPEMLPVFESAFADYGIRLFDDVDEVGQKINDSRIKDDLVLGLYKWYSQFDWNFHFTKMYSEKSWFRKLMDIVDPDSYRREIREIVYGRKWKQMFAEIETESSIESPLTTYLFVEGFKKMSRHEVDYLDDQQLEDLQRNYLLRALLNFPNDYRLNYSLAEIYTFGLKPDRQRALNHWFACLAIQPDNALAGLRIARIFHESKQFELAEKHYLRVWSMTKKYPQALINLATMFELTGEQQRGVDFCDEVLKWFPKRVEAHFNRSVLLSQLGKFEEALAAAKQAHQLNPDYAATYGQLCRLYQRKGSFDEAIKFGLEAVKREPKSQLAWGSLADVYEVKGKPGKAAECYEKLLDLKPNSIHYLMGHCKFLVLNGEPEKAIPLLKEKFVGSKFEKLAKKYLARALEEAGDLEAAEELLQELCRQYPEDAYFESQLERLREILRIANF